MKPDLLTDCLRWGAYALLLTALVLIVVDAIAILTAETHAALQEPQASVD